MAEINIAKEKFTLTTKRIPKESLSEYSPGNPSSLQLFFEIHYQTHQKVMCITETGCIIPWSTWTNDEYSLETFKSNLDMMKNNYESFCCHLLYKLNKLGIESHNHKKLISQMIDIVCETINSKPMNILQQHKVLPLAMTIVCRKTHFVPERVLILEASRLEFERENYGMVPAAKEWIDRVLMNSEKVVTTTTEKENCSICFEEIVEIGSVMPCDHVFHKNCIKEWLVRSHLCPLCRYEMPVET